MFFNILLFGDDEYKRINLIAAIIIGVSPIVHLLIISGINAPYGRYTSATWGMLLNAKFAWFLQVDYQYIFVYNLVFCYCTVLRTFNLNSFALLPIFDALVSRLIVLT